MSTPTRKVLASNHKYLGGTHNEAPTNIVKQHHPSGKSHKKSRKKDEIMLWGVGIEAEFALFHDPKISLDERHPKFLFFDPQKGFEKPMTRLYYYYYTKPAPRNKSFLDFPPKVRKALELSQNIDVEHAGKVCKGKVIVGKNYDYVYYLLEARTDEPFSGKNYGVRYVDKYVSNLQSNIRGFIQSYRQYRPEYQKKNNKVYGGPIYYPYGMSSRIRLRNLNTNKFSNGPTVDNYTGSYHFTFTLPHTYPGSCEVLSQNHKYFANLIQWVEPLIATAFHSCDDRSIGESDQYTKGSFRVVMAAWGDFGGSDVRKIRCVKDYKRKTPTTETNKESLSLTRYASHKVKWRDDLPFKNINLLEPCRDDLKTLHFQNSLGADFRTPYMRFQEKRKIYDLQAIEVRIFDWFDPKHLKALSILLVLLAERSRTHRVKKYVYRSNSWNNTVRNVMIHGWNAKLDKQYIQELEKVFGFKIKPKNMRARNILSAFIKSLFDVTKNGEWTRFLLKDKLKTAPPMPNINRRSWENGYVLYLMENRKAHQNLKRFITQLNKDPDNSITSLKARKLYRKTIGGSNWDNNFTDIIGFLENIGIVKANIKSNGEISIIKIVRSKTNSINNLRKIWELYQSG